MMEGATWESLRPAVPGVVAFAAGTGATWMVRGLARRYGIVNKPNPLVPQHTKPIAYLGGVGLAIGAACGAGALHVFTPGAMENADMPLLSLALPAVLFLALGVVDDLIAFAPARKFVLQALVAVLAVALGLWSPLTGVEIIDRGIAWLWIVTLVNAFNLTDVCDGLLGSLSAVSFAFIGLSQPALAPMCVVLIASCCGFLVYNRPPASIFMGDAGSHLLGFAAAALTLAGAKAAHIGVLSNGMIEILLVGVPMFELVFLIVIRTRKGLAWWRGSPDHFSLRMQAGGMTRLRTDLIACGAAALLGGGALAVQRVGLAGQVAVAIGAIALSLVAARLLLRWEVKRPPAAPVAPNVALENRA